jgi:hypothetical protein
LPLFKSPVLAIISQFLLQNALLTALMSSEIEPSKNRPLECPPWRIAIVEDDPVMELDLDGHWSTPAGWNCGDSPNQSDVF